MTHRAAYEMTETAADAICSKNAAMGGFGFSGRAFTRESATTLSYYASKSDHTKFAAMVAAHCAAERGEPAATDSQISYLSNLISDEPGMATNIGAHVRPGLTKAEASKFISLMNTGV